MMNLAIQLLWLLIYAVCLCGVVYLVNLRHQQLRQPDPGEG